MLPDELAVRELIHPSDGLASRPAGCAVSSARYRVRQASTMLQPANPLLQPWDTPFQLPPFDRIQPGHFAPAFEAAVREHAEEIAAIAANPEAPTFENTVVAFDRSGRRLMRIEQVFFNLASSETSPALQAVEREVAPKLAAHESAIYLDAKLFARVDELHARREALGLDDEQRRLLERIHLDFVLAGARLGDEAKARLAQIVERLAQLHTAFSQNVLADESNWVLWLRAEAGPRRTAGVGARRREGRCRRARRSGRLGDHDQPVDRRSVPDVLRPPRPARAGVPGLEGARRERRRARQPSDRARDPEAAHRAGAADGISELCRLRAGRSHGGDAGGRAAIAAARVGAREGAGARGVFGAAGPGRGDGPADDPRAMGLALLRGEGAPGALRRRRRAREAVLSAGARRRGRLRLRASAVRGAVRRAPRPEGVSPGRARLRSPARRTHRRASSCTTTSRVPPSAAARG